MDRINTPDWRVNSTFRLLLSENPGISIIPFNVLRQYYIKATSNLSKGSFFDLLDKCELFGVIKKIDFEKKEVLL